MLSRVFSISFVVIILMLVVVSLDVRSMLFIFTILFVSLSIFCFHRCTVLLIMHILIQEFSSEATIHYFWLLNYATTSFLIRPCSSM